MANIYADMNISDEVYEYTSKILDGLKERFEKIDMMAEINQMKVLKDTYLVKSRREGKTVYYALADDHVQSIVCQGYEHVCEDKE